MKIRTDFVTNSSSSSFMIGRKGKLSEEQKARIIDYVEKKYLGGEVFLVPGATDEEIQEIIENSWGVRESDIPKIKEALEAGFTLYQSYVEFEIPEWTVRELYQEMWDQTQTDDASNIILFDTDLSY